MYTATAAVRADGDHACTHEYQFGFILIACDQSVEKTKQIKQMKMNEI